MLCAHCSPKNVAIESIENVCVMWKIYLGLLHDCLLDLREVRGLEAGQLEADVLHQAAVARPRVLAGELRAVLQQVRHLGQQQQH